MKLMDSLEIFYRRKDKDLNDLERKLKEIFRETGIVLDVVNSESAGKIFLKINVLEDQEEVPNFVVKALTPETDATELPLGEWATLDVFVEEVDYLEDHEYMKIFSDGNRHTLYVPYSSVKNKNRNEVVKEFMRYFFETKGWNPDNYEFFVQEVDNII
ncbi:DUF3855 domain-containing protein [Thermotoga sp.]|uniref:DUF3855 domain-containing protein n=1 Tax=Thermotoga sp. TaxID=28240 RepID=UPI0025DDA85E|nr:DUF3855 domain-containing protein [Thermotoga sp.]MCD6550970.1 DUF3855 domain-containing protein [Thermotoga sp.]